MIVTACDRSPTPLGQKVVAREDEMIVLRDVLERRASSAAKSLAGPVTADRLRAVAREVAEQGIQRLHGQARLYFAVIWHDELTPKGTDVFNVQFLASPRFEVDRLEIVDARGAVHAVSPRLRKITREAITSSIDDGLLYAYVVPSQFQPEPQAMNLHLKQKWIEDGPVIELADVAKMRVRLVASDGTVSDTIPIVVDAER